MCLYTKYIENPKYKPNKKNSYNPPICEDRRLFYVPVKCGKCIECRQQKQRAWIVRLSEELRSGKGAGLFVTLTFNEESYKELAAITKNENDMCRLALYRMNENYRQKYKHTIRHWCVTELGDNGRIHIHGIMWCSASDIEKYWKYGYIYIGRFVNEQTILYITKYMLKYTTIDKNFEPKVLCSKGIGIHYLDRLDSKRNSYRENNTDESYILRSGKKINLPDYYKRKIYTEEEREKMWIEKQEKGYRYIMGEKVSTDNEEKVYKLMEYWRKKAKELYNERPQEWDREKHKKALKRRKEYLARFGKSVNNTEKSVNN